MKKANVVCCLHMGRDAYRDASHTNPTTNTLDYHSRPFHHTTVWFHGLVLHQWEYIYIYNSFDTGDYHDHVGLVFTRVPQANQTSDILWYPVNNKFIMYCSCVNTIVTEFLVQ